MHDFPSLRWMVCVLALGCFPKFPEDTGGAEPPPESSNELDDDPHHDHGGGGQTTHSTCDALDGAGVLSRLSDLTASDPSVLDLNGDCWENTENATEGQVQVMRFSSDPGVDTPALHIELRFVLPAEPQDLYVWAPEQLSVPDCTDVPTDAVCLHVESEATDEQVDLRAKTGELSLTTAEIIDDTLHYSGTFEVVVWGVDSTTSPDAYSQPSVMLAGELEWWH